MNTTILVNVLGMVFSEARNILEEKQLIQEMARNRFSCITISDNFNYESTCSICFEAWPFLRCSYLLHYAKGPYIYDAYKISLFLPFLPFVEICLQIFNPLQTNINMSKFCVTTNPTIIYGITKTITNDNI